MRADLWTCGRCGRQFANRNQSHSCGAYSVDAFLASSTPVARALFWRFAELVQSCGDVSFAPARFRIGFQARMIFASVNALGRANLDAHVVLTRRLQSPRFRRIDSLSERCHVHHFRVTELSELDDEVLEWLKESYLVGEQRHLGS